jgi:hypothetical protein
VRIRINKTTQTDPAKTLQFCIFNGPDLVASIWGQSYEVQKDGDTWILNGKQIIAIVHSNDIQYS